MKQILFIGEKTLMEGATLRRIREDVLYASREDLARRTRSVSLGTIRNAELGKKVKRTTASQLLEAINALLAEVNKPTVTMDDLGLTL